MYAPLGGCGPPVSDGDVGGGYPSSAGFYGSGAPAHSPHSGAGGYMGGDAALPTAGGDAQAFRGGPPSLRGARGGGGRGAQGAAAPPPPHLVGGRVRKEGDWQCEDPACGNINFSKRTRCNRCGKNKPKTGDPLKDIPNLGGPPGLFKQGDWPCTHCGNVNWARRNTCNICSAPKPSTHDEPRTGRGGGHFDLQDPADRRRHDSDDEDFDEFGRRKRKHGAHAQAQATGGLASGAAGAAHVGPPSPSATLPPPLRQGQSAASAALPAGSALGAGGAERNGAHVEAAARGRPDANAVAAGAEGGRGPSLQGGADATESGCATDGVRGAFGGGAGSSFGEGDFVGVKLAFPPAPKRRLVSSSSSSSSSSSESESSRSPSRSRRSRRSRSRSRSDSRRRARRRSPSREENRRSRGGDSSAGASRSGGSSRRDRERERDRRSRSRSPRDHRGSSNPRR
ncbi:ran binding protein [Besnoitia besnoiti]|uniref:Ran binding protein n=1 Tax=Besnoitia besnoiti TaxID=94643 RepID=A0A2A9MP38_BESBE|nr:ran binding protein [Besnoitia besnoiti]PFH37540.1 ran binding protein [Besnoitia besnoiti]